MPSSLKLRVVNGTDAGRVVDAPPEGVIIGRSPQADIVLQGARLSRQHVCIYQRRGKDWIIEDLGSRNGTLVNGVPVAKGLLYPGDRIDMSAVTLRVGGGFPRRKALAAAIGVVGLGVAALAGFAYASRSTATAPPQVRPAPPPESAPPPVYMTRREALRQEAAAK